MEETALLAPLLLTIAGLTVGAIFKSLFQRTRIPYTVGLFAIGLAAGIMNRMGVFHGMPQFSAALDSVANINPDLILYIFLPILIFDAAYELNLHIFKKTLTNATLLAAPGLIICMILTAGVLMAISFFVPGYEKWTWASALMFGALISATDPVAVVALLHELKTSKRFSTLVDAESLLNDGTGIVCFMLFYGITVWGRNDELTPILEFCQVVAGGAILGFIAARLVIWFITRVNSEEMIQNSVIILSAYLVFILAQLYLGISGVIALVAFGLTIAYVGKPRLKPQVNIFMGSFWELLTYIANTLIFIIVGIVIAEKVDFSWSHCAILLLVYIALNIIRYITIMMLYPIMKRSGYGLNKKESIILTWGGLRGALGMTLALMVSYTPAIPEEIRSQVLFFTAGTVTLTLCINATTMRWLLNKLGLIYIPTARTMMENKIQNLLHENSEQYFERLKTREALNGANWEKVSQYVTASPSAQEATPMANDVMNEIRLRVLDKEKMFLHQIYDEGIISKTSFMQLSNSLDELYDHDGSYALDTRTSIFNFCNRTFILDGMQRIPKIGSWISFYFKERIGVVHDLGRGFIILQKEDLKLLDDLEGSNMLSGEQKVVLKTLRAEIQHNLDTMNGILNKLANDFPKAYKHALTQKATRMLLCNERRNIRQLQTDGMLSDKDAEQLYERVDERSEKLNSLSHTIPASFVRWLMFKKKKA
ncbi:sodium:proton antiporter [Phocaeicola barnesiae]|uniref:cation:proton antiporter n=1 Tax=Phocaeicola barnesiae TaxID=376804 RepID=UPI001F1749AE|nr:sodium:proton antiporter [Phocaeicola barnesiae]MBS6468994.1 sodium:proton antiporter [Bacteroides sp.]MCF2599763.1 sodium:proton antiporter [Phocaeicola barnesiae]MDM8241394.1 sodium:proton antiporter [Phocaeicola barnesiae]